MKMKFSVLILAFVGLIVQSSMAQLTLKERKRERSIPAARPSSNQISSIESRGTATHNRSNVGMFFENRGKLYARSSAIGVSGEFPINSEQEYIYQLNPFVLMPGNVIQARDTGNEEWEALEGFNPLESAKVAISTDPESWPNGEWPIKDAQGNPIFVSDQDSYAAYHDLLNREGKRDIVVYQTGYSFSFPLVRDAVVYTFDVVNRSSETYDDVYFGMYSDFDIGNAAGVGDPEYEDDLIGYDEDIDLLYFYDDGRTIDWTNGTTGHFGLTYISTPEVNGQKLGLTDWHYNLWQDTDLWNDDDSILYNIWTSNFDALTPDFQNRFFHPAQSGSRKDDPTTIPASGADLTANSASGPYTIGPGDTLQFVIAVVAGRDYDQLRATAENLHSSYATNWLLPSAPPRPFLQATAENDRVHLRWDTRSERTPDPFSGMFDFKGYNLYRSIDNGRTWDQIDRNVFPEAGANPIPLATFDVDEGTLAYSYTDSTVQEGFTYWYSLTAYDTPIDGLGRLESAIGTNEEEQNISVVTPLPNPTDWQASVTELATQLRGSSTDTVALRSLDPFDLNETTYTIEFSRAGKVLEGNLLTQVEVEALDLQQVDATLFTLSWSAPDIFSIKNENSGRNRLRNVTYVPGQRYEIAQDFVAFTFTELSNDLNFRPEAGDVLQIVPTFSVLRNGDSEFVLKDVYHQRDIEFVTSDGIGVTFKHQPFEIISEIEGISVQPIVSDYQALIEQEIELRFEAVINDSLEVTVITDGRADTPIRINRFDTFNLGRFSIDFVFELPVAPQNWIGNSIFISVDAVRFPTEGDVYEFAKTAGRIRRDRVEGLLDQINVAPNPYVVYNRWESDISLQQREPVRLLRFRHLPNQCTIHIFTMSGERVKTLSKNDTNGTLGWDLRTEAGREIAPGVYIYQVETEFGTVVKRFAVIK